MIRSVLHRRITLTLAMVVFAVSVLVGLPPSAAHAAATWKPQKSGTEMGLSSVAFPDATHGWAVGGDQVILATADGGATWAAQTPDTEHGLWLNSVDFTDADHGWAVAGDGIIATTDGGATWVDQESGTEFGLNSIAFIDARHGWAVGDRGVIVTTNDGGVTWTAQSTEVPYPAGSADFNSQYGFESVCFADADHGWAVGDGSILYGTPVIYSTSDGGANWTVQKVDVHEDLNGVFFTDSTSGWAVGVDGTVIATTDGGATWTAQASGTDENLRSVAFVGKLHGWAVGWSGTIIATTDGGATWIAENSRTKDSLNAVTFVNKTHGWAVGENGTIVVYNTAPAPSVWSAIPSAAWPVATVLVVLAIVGGVVLALRARRRKVSNGAGPSAGLPSDPRARTHVAGGSSTVEGGEKVGYCTRCGSPIRSGSAFCASCGAKTAR
jgi:photosystem II stability/assembly factor-like uncharacterized protein